MKYKQTLISNLESVGQDFDCPHTKKKEKKERNACSELGFIRCGSHVHVMVQKEG